MSGYLEHNRQILTSNSLEPRVLTEKEFNDSKEKLKKDIDEKVMSLRIEIDQKFKNIIGMEE